MEVLTLQRQQLTMHASCVLITWSSVTASARAEHQVSSLEDALFVSIINRLFVHHCTREQSVASVGEFFPCHLH